MFKIDDESESVTKIPAHSRKRRAIRTGYLSLELYFVGRDSGGTRPARR